MTIDPLVAASLTIAFVVLWFVLGLVDAARTPSPARVREGTQDPHQPGRPRSLSP